MIYIDIQTTNGFDATATLKTYSSTASPWASNALTTTNANDMVISCISNDSLNHTYTVPTGFTAVETITNQCECADQIVSTVQNTAYTWTGTGAADSMALIALAFKGTLGNPTFPRRPALWF
jgi:hypothetical protein